MYEKDIKTELGKCVGEWIKEGILLCEWTKVKIRGLMIEKNKKSAISE